MLAYSGMMKIFSLYTTGVPFIIMVDNNVLIKVENSAQSCIVEKTLQKKTRKHGEALVSMSTGYHLDSPINFTGSLIIYIDPIACLHFHLMYMLVKSFLKSVDRGSTYNMFW